MIDQKCKRCLLELAHNTLIKLVKEEQTNQHPKCDKCKIGATFVTLKKQGKLRGCIGTLEASEELYKSVIGNTKKAAFKDPRFYPVREEELSDIEIEISVLSESKPLHYTSTQDLLNKLRASIDGVIITKNLHSATFLPQVWEQLPEKEDFLSHLCLKAGLNPDEWKSGTLEIQTYQVISFNQSNLYPTSNPN